MADGTISRVGRRLAWLGFGVAATAVAIAAYSGVMAEGSDPNPTPPVTAIDSGPAGPTAGASPTFTFSSERGVSFSCKLDELDYEPCESGVTYPDLADGSHHFAVFATDASDNREWPPARRAFSIDTRVERIAVAVKRRQNQRGWRIRIRARAGAGEPVRVTVRGVVAAAGGPGPFRLRSITKFAAGGRRAAFYLTPKRRGNRARMVKLLRRNKRLRAQMSIAVTDGVGNSVTRHRRVLLARR